MLTIIKKNNFVFGFYLKIKYGVKVKPEDKVVLLNVEDNKFNRYLYPFIHFLNTNGYKCILKLDNVEIASIFRGNYYHKMIFSENLLFRPSSKMNITKSINLKPDYFYALSKKELRQHVIPMPMHPLVYERNIKNTENYTNKVIFFAGNVSYKHYSRKQIFDDIIPRYYIVEYIKNFSNCILVKNKGEEIKAYKNSNQLFYVIYNKHTYPLSQTEMFKELSKSSFYLALPGVTMPLCHNIIEAMYCKSIPILQDIYADMFPIPLVNKINCFTYNKKEDLLEISNYIERMSFNEIKVMQKNVEKYYHQYLSEEAISKLVTETKNVDFYLQAENHSLRLFSKRKASKSIKWFTNL